SLGDACFSGNVGRKHHAVRAAIVVTPEERGQGTLSQIMSGESFSSGGRWLHDDAPPRQIVMLFSGQGAQYPKMLQDLHRTSPVFRGALNRCARFLDNLLPRPLEEVLFTDEINDRAAAIHQTGFTQPALF